MQKRLNRLCAALALAALSSAAGAAGSLVLAPGTSDVTFVDNGVVDAAEMFSVLVRGDSFSESVVGGGFDLSFDPAVVRLESVTINSAVWEFAPSGGTINNSAGTLSTAAFATFAATPPSGNFLAATLNFSAKAVGNSALTLLPSAVAVFASAAGDPISVTFGSGTVNVVAVPEPATWASMALGSCCCRCGFAGAAGRPDP
jgi:hypothetical protein